MAVSLEQSKWVPEGLWESKGRPGGSEKWVWIKDLGDFPVGETEAGSAGKGGFARVRG